MSALKPCKQMRNKPRKWTDLKPLARLQRATHFTHQFVRNPRNTGSIMPSGNRLSQYIAQQAVSHMQQSGAQQLIELGPGNGVITNACLAAGISAKKIICIECNPTFAAALKIRFSQTQIIQDSAENLVEILEYLGIQQPSVIISSLPLRSLPKACAQRIRNAISSSLTAHGRLIQYTYGLSQPFMHHQNLKPVNKKIILRNIPPAVAWTFKTRA